MFKMLRDLHSAIHIFSSLFILTVLAKPNNLPTETAYKKYEPPAMEKRVWTDTSGPSITLDSRIPYRAMKLTTRDFATNCDGACYYHLGDPDRPQEAQCTPGMKECHLAASIAMHDPATTCPFIKSAFGKLNEHICNKTSDVIYSVSLMRRIKFPKARSCQNSWDYNKKLPCYPTEFVAIQFLDQNITKKDYAKKFWFVCVAGETTVTFWENDEQKLDTTPVYGTAPGVIATTYMNLDYESRTFACQFLISAAGLKADQLLDVEFNVAQTPIIIRMIQGRVIREETLAVPEILERIKNSQNDYDENLVNTNVVAEYYRNQKTVLHPDFNSTNPDYETILAETFIGAGMDTPGIGILDFSQIQNTVEVVHDTTSLEDHKKTEAKIHNAIKRCEEKHVKCFTPDQHVNCLYRKKCPVMAIVEPVPGTKLKRLKFKLIYFINRRANVKQATRPFGYAAMGFSFDDRMGDDLVVACKLTEESKEIIVTWNKPHNNRVNLTANQHLIQDKEVIAAIYETADKVMCSWTMDAQFEVEVGFSYNPPDQGHPEQHVSFDLMQPSCKAIMFVLLATGSQVYPDSTMGYHSFRRVIRGPYMVRDGFSSAVKPAPIYYSLIAFSIMVSVIM